MGDETRSDAAESEAGAGPEGGRLVEPHEGVTSEERQPTGPGTEHPTDGEKRGELGEAGEERRRGRHPGRRPTRSAARRRAHGAEHGTD